MRQVDMRVANDTGTYHRNSPDLPPIPTIMAPVIPRHSLILIIHLAKQISASTIDWGPERASLLSAKVVPIWCLTLSRPSISSQIQLNIKLLATYYVLCLLLVVDLIDGGSTETEDQFFRGQPRS